MSALGIALDLALRRRGAAFDPVQLFPGGTLGALYDPAPGQVWQDAAGTLPAAVGDPVGLLADRSGNGNHAVQASAAARPVLRQDSNGRHYLECDGIDDFLRAGFALPQPWERICALRQVGWGANRHVLGGVTVNAGVLQQFGASAALRLFSGTGSATTNSEPVLGANEVIAELHSGAASSLTVNAGAPVIADYGSAATAGVTIGASSSGASFSSIRLYALAMRDGPLTASARASLRAWMAARAAISM
ncbi:MAG TPA: hypothetical protein VGW34_04515 [Allosphingosinicella sp.]|nr:hypothetical protein [Allosphingosinicella sp.]